MYDHGEQAYPPSAYVDGWQVLHYCTVYTVFEYSIFITLLIRGAFEK